MKNLLLILLLLISAGVYGLNASAGTTVSVREYPVKPGEVTIVANNDVPKSLELYQNYPNPFNPSTKISFAVPNTGVVKLSVYNILGTEVATLINESLSPGIYSFNFDASSLNSGIYFYKLSMGNFTLTRKMTLLR